MEQIMPKITVSGGPSNKDLPTEGVASSPGNSSSLSTEMPNKSSETNELESLKPVPTMDNLSSPDPTESDSVDPTDGSTPETGTVVLPEIPKRNASKAEWAEFTEAVGLQDAESYTRDELVAWWEESG